MGLAKGQIPFLFYLKRKMFVYRLRRFESILLVKCNSTQPTIISKPEIILNSVVIPVLVLNQRSNVSRSIKALPARINTTRITSIAI